VSALPISIEPEAEADQLEAHDWYEKQRPGLGRAFIDCVDEVFENIRAPDDVCDRLPKRPAGIGSSLSVRGLLYSRIGRDFSDLGATLQAPSAHLAKPN
jgi:hypothetical protein